MKKCFKCNTNKHLIIKRKWSPALKDTLNPAYWVHCTNCNYSTPSPALGSKKLAKKLWNEYMDEMKKWPEKEACRNKEDWGYS